MKQDLTNAQLKRYEQDGYLILKDFFTEDELSEWEESIVRIYAFQAIKIPIMKGRLKKGDNPLKYMTVEDLDDLVLLFEEMDKKASHLTSLLTRHTYVGKKLVANNNLLNVASQILKCPREFLIIPDHNPCLFVNLPSQVGSFKRLLYHWHSEMNSYPKRRSFLTYWFPVFRDKSEDNGTMYFCKGSHVKKHDFAQYSGFDDESLNMKNAYTQFETPEYELTEFEKVPVICPRGGLVIFKDNLVHRSSPNQTKVTSYTTVIRMYDYSRDLTLSHDATAGHFGGEPYARPGLLAVKYKR